MPKYRFVGKVVAQKDDETVLTDQTHHLYWVRIAHFHVNVDFVTVETEWAESGGSLAGILEQLAEMKEAAPYSQLLNELVRVQ